jgi:hypothetical protein
MRPFSVRAKVANAESSAWQSGHHDAKKFKTTGDPRRRDSWTSAPPRKAPSEKSGATVPTAREGGGVSGNLRGEAGVVLEVSTTTTNAMSPSVAIAAMTLNNRSGLGWPSDRTLWMVPITFLNLEARAERKGGVVLGPPFR